MDSLSAESLLAELRTVDAERARRAADPELDARVQSLKTYQQRRFAHTYADLLANPRYEAATRFFLHELYGPGDYRQRDAQFARVIPTLTRLFPEEVIDTVARLARLHALSERLDTRMAEHLMSPELSAHEYAIAWRACGEPDARRLQIELTMAVGESLDRLTRKPLLRQSLKLMRGPAQLAGLGALQGFLESGFDTFKAMRGAGEFLSTVRQREDTLARGLFQSDTSVLGQLP
ncbi:FFLEELY motif protein [Roseateles sp. BYS78W]|uniref:FFLEELY motif protein n=1 Tax=Pelomonas candidula TaxID=3299025 RepID=A0ABW7H965_9BURK